MQEYDVVRSTRLLTPSRENSGTETVMRQPQVGDVGTIVYVLHDAGTDSKYVVECGDEDGMTVWFRDFNHNELRLQK